MNRKTPKFIRLLGTFALVFAVALIALYSVYMVWEQPPGKADAPLAARAPQPPADPTDTPASEAPALLPSPSPTEEPGGVYTVLLVGNDDGNGNTDTLLLARLDTGAHSLHVVSIPRDTLVNADWQVRKVNAVYWGDRLQGGSGIDALRRHIRMLTGFEPENYAVLDLADLVRAVDLLGGLDFEVPFAMHYDDPSQNLHIHLEAGQQHLGGEQVMGLLRYRSGYPTGDLGRIEMQQRFLRACLDQYAALGKVPNLMAAAEYLAGAVDTDLTAANMAWYLRQALRCGEDITFETLPTEPATVHGYSYAVVRLWDWLTMLNGGLNPTEREITAADLDLVYRGEQGFTATGELRGAWYYSWTPPAAPAAAVPSAPAPAVTPEPPAGPKIITVFPGGV